MSDDETGDVRDAKASDETPAARVLVLIAFIAAVLTGLLMPPDCVNEFRRGHGHPPYVWCLSNIRGLNAALLMYDADHGIFPTTLLDAFASMRTTPRHLCCPAVRGEEVARTGYFYVLGLKETDPEDWIVIFDDPENHAEDDRVNVVRLSGFADALSRAGFENELARFKREFEASRGHPPKFEGPDTKLSAEWQSPP